MSNKADDLRKQAEIEIKAAGQSKSLRDGVSHRRRGKALNDMADTEDRLESKTKPEAKD
ncbi:MAG TPA: hypothetical protein VLJ17_14650 [Xanthobacteraceae bacterium]|nr:hypothetical protein [Xanthobacteraceae bacterium]